MGPDFAADLPPLTLVIGGAASGKSEYAEQLVQAFAAARVYLATGQAGDGEMAEKIARHAARRGPGWRVEEAPLDLGPALAQVAAGEPVLLDCATMWLANHLFAESDFAQAQEELFAALARCAGPVVVVTNEVGQGIVPADALSRRFREAQGRVNIALAARADRVVHVVAGLPNVLKGQ